MRTKITIVQIKRKHNQAWYNDMIGSVFFTMECEKPHDRKIYLNVVRGVSYHYQSGVDINPERTSHLVKRTSVKIIGSFTLSTSKAY